MLEIQITIELTSIYSSNGSTPSYIPTSSPPWAQTAASDSGSKTRPSRPTRADASTRTPTSQSGSCGPQTAPPSSPSP
jgi:hypothetical protein